MSRTEIVYVRDSAIATYALPIADVPAHDLTGLVDGVAYGPQHHSYAALGDDPYIVFIRATSIPLITDKAIAEISAATSGGGNATATPHYSVVRIGDKATVYAPDNTDTLDAIVVGTGPWTAVGKITGDNSTEPGRYDFAGLADDTEYTVRVRVGASPSATDVVVATIPIPGKSEIRNALKGRWTNQGTGTNYDDIKIEDAP